MNTIIKPAINISNLSAATKLLFSCLIIMSVLSGCASTKTTNRQLAIGHVPKPANIWVYDFAASPDDIPADSALAQVKDLDLAPLSAEAREKGERLGVQIATELVKQIRDLGMPAQNMVEGSEPQINDIVIHGYILFIDEGSEEKRVGVGFGDGASELKVAAEGFQMTAGGLRKLGYGTTDATGSKTPGSALGVASLIVTHNPVGLIVGTGMKVHDEKTGSGKVEGRAKQTAGEISSVLKTRFQEQGWIK